MYDIVIVGAGPAGLSAAIYARRAEKSVLVIERESFGGQMTQSPRIENYPGFTEISGNELAERLVDQALAQGAEIELDTVVGISGVAGEYTVECEGASYSCRAVIIAAGSSHRTLGIDGEEKLVGEGISYCAVCDGAFYRDKSVAVIGGGNSALVDAVMLSESCKSVTVVQNLPYLTGEERLSRILNTRENVSFIFSATVKSFIERDGTLTGILLDCDGEERELICDGIFVAIGQIPDNKPFESVAALDPRGYIIAGEDCTPSGAPSGIFAAGDCRTKAVRQVSTAAADGAVAALSACRFIDSLNV